MIGRLDAEAVARARAVPDADEIHRRGMQLRRVGVRHAAQEAGRGVGNTSGHDAKQVVPRPG
jgi:hypothetical protein